MGTLLGSLILLGGLLALTVWNVTRSDALAQARQAYIRGELVSCLQHALEHLQRRSWSRDAALLAARCLSRLDYADSAEAYYHRAGELDLSDLQTRAYGLVRGNHRQRAIQAYEEILVRWPDNVTALRRLAAVQLSENNTPELEKLANRLIHIPNGAAIGYTLRGVVAHNDRNYEQAAASFEKVLEIDPNLQLMPLPRQIFWSHLATSMMSSGRIDDASRYLTRVLADTPDIELMNTLGRAYFLQGLIDEAERCYRQAVEWDPSDYLAHYNLGKIELQRHRLEAALNDLNAARELAPGRTDALYSLVIVYRLLQQPAEVARMEGLIKQIHEHPAPLTRSSKDRWPRYAL